MPEQHEMAGLTTNPGMDTEIQADVSLHSADMPDRSFEARLLEQVTCHICTGVLYNPVTLHFCGHVFCGGCVTPWLRSNCTCPMCRAYVRMVTDDFRAQNLVELYLHLDPSKVRSEVEIQELCRQHRRGEKIEIQLRETDEDDEDYNEELEEDEEDEEAETSWFYQPCRWCDPNNGGFVCPTQLAAPGFNEIPDEHLWCRDCGHLFPDRGTPEQRCASCGRSCCHYMNPTCRRSELKPFTEPLFTDADEHRESEIIHHGRFNSNDTEYLRFMRYKWENNLKLEDLRVMIVQYYRDHPDRMTLSPGRCFTPDSLICEQCRRSAFTSRFLDWWAIQVNELRVVPDDRPKCSYGRECLTQHTILRHRERLNHLDPIAPELEPSDAFGHPT